MQPQSKPTDDAAEAAAKVIAEFRAQDLREVEFERLKSLVADGFIGMCREVVWTQPEQLLYRGVGPAENCKPTNLSRISYPPIQYATTWGRVTRPGQNAFYSSVAKEPIAWELGLKAGDHIAFGRWRSTAQLLLMQVGFHERALQTLGGNRTAATWASESVSPLTELDRMIDEFFSSEFCKIVPPGEEHLYKGSVAIAEPLLRSSIEELGGVPGYTGLPRVAGLLYPSIAAAGEIDNIALLPTVVDDSLRLEFVEWARVEAMENGRCKLTYLDCASSFAADGQIEWKGRPPEFTIPFGGRHEVVNGVNQAFDASGARILPS